jgi:hypothetical protein
MNTDEIRSLYDPAKWPDLEATRVLDTLHSLCDEVDALRASTDAIKALCDEADRPRSTWAGTPLRVGMLTTYRVRTTLADASETAAVLRYQEAIDAGLSDHEAREDGWPITEPCALCAETRQGLSGYRACEDHRSVAEEGYGA